MNQPSGGLISITTVIYYYMLEHDAESCDTDLIEGLQNLKSFI